MNGYSLGREQILGLVNDAREFQVAYRRMAKIDSGDDSPFDYWGERFATYDEMALRLFERHKGFIATGISLRGEKIKVRGRVGMLEPDGNVFSGNDTLDITLEDAIESTTVSRFGLNVCDVVENIATNGNRQIKAIMIPNALQFAKRTRDEINKHIRPKYQTGPLRKHPYHS